MATLKQIAANRRNAQHSTGPRSSEGKIASSRNSFRSGIYADRETVLPTEDPVALEELRQEYLDHYQPASPAERCLLDSLISDEWLLRRFRRVEGELLTEANSEISQSAERFCIGTSYRNNEATLERLQRRINATRKSYLKTLESLTALQSLDREQAQSPAPNHVPAPATQPLPDPIGFVPPTRSSSPKTFGFQTQSPSPSPAPDPGFRPPTAVLGPRA